MPPTKKICTKTFLTKLTKDTKGVLDGMTTGDVAKLIQEANYAYYNTSTPLLSDNLYDVVREYLVNKDPKNHVLKEVGAHVVDRKVKLPYPMGSLDKLKTDDGNALDKFKTKFPGNYLISDKLDGNSALFHFKSGNVTLYSRGDGKTGQNISSVLSHISGIPNTEYFENKEVAVRGELIINRENFTKVADKGANARNMVAGVLNAKLPDLDILALVEFVAYELVYPVNKTMAEQMKELRCMGFQVVHNEIVLAKQFNVDNLSNILVRRRQDSRFEIDGIVVISADKVHERNTSGNPDYAFAFKSVQTMEKAEVIVTRVEWNTSKDGYLIPVINFNPVALNGVVIQRAHGFNGKYIKDNKIGPGSKLVIIRSGDVIPYVSQIISASETGEPQMPEMEYSWSSSGVDIIVQDNHEVTLKSLQYFFDKVDVVGVSAATIKRLFDAGYTTPKKIFTVKLTDLTKIDGFKDRMAQKVYDALSTRWQELQTWQNCLLVIDASNTLGRGIGSKKLELIIDVYPQIIKEGYVPTIDELIKIKGVEKKTAEKIIQNLPSCFKFLEENGFTWCTPAAPILSPAKNTKSHGTKMMHEVVVFTGVRNKKAETFIESNGGKVTTTVSKKTTLVICKDLDSDSGSMKKARELGIKILSLEQFEKLNQY